MKLIFLGPPGAGKGTMAEKAVKESGLVQISTGELFRAAIKNETPVGKKVQAIIKAGDLVPDELTIEIVKERLETISDNFILDGFPRTTFQAEALEDFCAIDAVINFTLADEEIIKRLSGRRLCSNCGASYHVDFVPPKKEGICDKCGKDLFIRDDDKIESIKNRLIVYKKSTEPLIKFYEDKGSLISVDASPAPAVVFESLKEILKTL